MALKALNLPPPPVVVKSGFARVGFLQATQPRVSSAGDTWIRAGARPFLMLLQLWCRISWYLVVVHFLTCFFSLSSFLSWWFCSLTFQKFWCSAQGCISKDLMAVQLKIEYVEGPASMTIVVSIFHSIGHQPWKAANHNVWKYLNAKAETMQPFWYSVVWSREVIQNSACD